MSGAFAETIVYFGKYRDWRLGAVPNWYLNWCLLEDWFEEKYPDLFEPFQDEMNWRKEQGVYIDD